jgi:hypothetical protein
MRRVGEALFFDEGVGVEPFEQVGGVAGGHLHLREVNMRVDEAGHQQMRPMINDLDVRWRLRGDIPIGAGSDDQAVFDSNAPSSS